MELSPKQAEILADDTRFKVACLARRCGKSHIGVIELYKQGSQNEKKHDKKFMYPDGYYPEKNIMVMAKNLAQVKNVWLPFIKDLLSAYIKPGVLGINKADLIVTLKNNVKIHLKSGENEGTVDSARGYSLDYFIGDECPFWRNFKYAWESVIMPALADKRGGALLISSPNGKDYFYELAMRGKNPELPDWSFHHGTYHDAYLKDAVAEMAELARTTTDPKTFAREWMASFEGSGAQVAYQFSYEANVRKLADLQPGEIVRVGMDFNIGINATIIFVLRGKEVHVIDEIFGKQNTEQVCEEIKKRYGRHKVIIYPDPTGNSRSTKATVGVTDFSIMRKFGFEVLSHKRTKSIIDGVNSLNMMFKNTLGETLLYISGKCMHLIQSLEKLSWKEDTEAATYKNPEYSHFVDALRYPIEFLFNLNQTKLTKIKIRGL